MGGNVFKTKNPDTYNNSCRQPEQFKNPAKAMATSAVRRMGFQTCVTQNFRCIVFGV
jgi:hypothetical protein